MKDVKVEDAPRKSEEDRLRTLPGWVTDQGRLSQYILMCRSNLSAKEMEASLGCSLSPSVSMMTREIEKATSSVLEPKELQLAEHVVSEWQARPRFANHAGRRGTRNVVLDAEQADKLIGLFTSSKK